MFRTGVEAMEINRSAPAIGEGEIQVTAPPETVWDVIADIDGWPRWNTDVKSTEVAGPVAVGSVFRWRSGASSLTSTLGVVDRPNEIAWTGTTMGIKAIHRAIQHVLSGLNRQAERRAAV